MAAYLLSLTLFRTVLYCRTGSTVDIAGLSVVSLQINRYYSTVPPNHKKSSHRHMLAAKGLTQATAYRHKLQPTGTCYSQGIYREARSARGLGTSWSFGGHQTTFSILYLLNYRY